MPARSEADKKACSCRVPSHFMRWFAMSYCGAHWVRDGFSLVMGPFSSSLTSAKGYVLELAKVPLSASPSTRSPSWHRPPHESLRPAPIDIPDLRPEPHPQLSLNPSTPTSTCGGQSHAHSMRSVFTCPSVPYPGGAIPCRPAMLVLTNGHEP